MSTGRWRLDYRRQGDPPPPAHGPTPWRDAASILLVCLIALLIASGLLLALLVAMSPGGVFKLK